MAVGRGGHQRTPTGVICVVVSGCAGGSPRHNHMPVTPFCCWIKTIDDGPGPMSDNRPRWPAAARRWYRLRRSRKEDRSPPPWAVARLAARIGAHGQGLGFTLGRNIVARLEWGSAQPAALFRRSATVRLVAESFAVGAVLAGIVGLWLDMDRREEDRINTAWALVAAAKEVEGNVGLGRALETLHARGEDLNALQAPKTYLAGVKLLGANLQKLIYPRPTCAGPT